MVICRFDFLWVNIQPTRNNQVFGAADDRNVAVAVDSAIVAGVEKTIVGKIFGRFLGHLPVTDKYVWTTYLQITNFSNIKDVTIVIANTCLDAG